MGSPKRSLNDRRGLVDKKMLRPRVVCFGNAGELDLRCSGRRNAIGTVVGKRQCEWFSQTSAVVAEVFRSSTHVHVPHRIPLAPATHGSECKIAKFLDRITVRDVTLVCQRAMKQIAGYFGGYISKKQKVGQFELKNLLSRIVIVGDKKIAQKKPRSASVLLAHVANTTFTTREGRCVMRSATEEYLIAPEYNKKDSLAAEFIRTFNYTIFLGNRFLDRYEALRKQRDTTI